MSDSVEGERKQAMDRQAQDQALVRIAGKVAKLGGWVVTVPDLRVVWSDVAAAIHDASPGFSPELDDATNFYAPECRERVKQAFRNCVELGMPFDLELQLVVFKGHPVWVRAIGEAVRTAEGRITHVQGAFQDISEKRAATDLVRRLSDRLHTTLETIRDAFFTVDLHWRFTYLNSAAERILRRNRTELLGRNLWVEFKEALGTESDHQYRRAMTEMVNVNFEQFFEPLGLWFEVEGHPSAEGLAVYFRDVTERRVDRDRVRESEERFRLFANTTHDAIWDWDLVTSALWWGDGFSALFGFGADEIEPSIESWTSRLHPAERTAVLDSIFVVINGGAPTWSREYRFLCKDGTYAFVLDRGRVIRDEHGKPIRMIGGMTDLTERRRVEERLHSQATLLDKATDAISVRDLHHRIMYWNRSAERLYGIAAAQAIGRSIRDILTFDESSFAVAMEATVDKGEWVGELEFVNEGVQPLVVQGRWTLVRDDEGEPKSILAIDTDITQRKNLEAQFLRAQRMESIGALAGGIAHDLNNTLAPILMAVSALHEEELNPERRDDLALVQTCAERGGEMVRQLLTFARGTEGRRTNVNLVKVIDEVEKIVRDTFPKNIAFRVNTIADPWHIKADVTQMHQLLTNFFVNARDAMPEGGTLTVGVEHVVLDDVYAGMTLGAKTGPYVLLRIEDTGMGMPPAVVDRIFEPFFTTKEIGRGTGLGLSTAHAIARSHGGFIHVYSEVGKGTRFRVYLPADISDASSQQALLDLETLPRGQGEQVLVVDDEEMIRNVARRTLERFGYRVLLASNGAEAVSLYAQHHQDIAVVLTDMTMPVMDGPATIVALRALNPKVLIIGSSGLGATGHVAKATGAGVQYFVPKPYTAEAMLRVLRKILSE